jgi:hypothetical protein
MNNTQQIHGVLNLAVCQQPLSYEVLISYKFQHTEQDQQLNKQKGIITPQTAIRFRSDDL